MQPEQKYSLLATAQALAQVLVPPEPFFIDAIN